MRRPSGHGSHILRWWVFAFLALASLIAIVPVLAQTGGIFDLSWFTVDSGGGSSAGGEYTLDGTAGQSDVGVMTGGDYTLDSGFWGGGGTVVNQYPIDILLSNNTIDEGQPINTVVGTLSTIDPNIGDTFTYALVCGEGDSGNASFNISGDQLRTSQVFDYDLQESYSIRIRSTDQGGLSCEKYFTVDVEALVMPGYEIFLPLILH